MSELDEAKRLFEQLVIVIDNIFVSSDQSLQKQSKIEQKEQLLVVSLKEIQAEKEQLKIDKETVLKEKALVQKLIAQKEAGEHVLTVQRQQLEKDKQEFEEKKLELLKLQEEAEFMVTKAHDIEEELRKVAYERQLVEKEKSIDRERKEMLDIRERRIEQTEAHLRRVSNG